MSSIALFFGARKQQPLLYLREIFSAATTKGCSAKVLSSSSSGSASAKYSSIVSSCNGNGLNSGINSISSRGFHTSAPSLGWDEFYDKKKPNELVPTGRAWTVADLRRKGFDDLHKLWFVLYKERNLLLSERQKIRKNQRPILAAEENRYTKVKRSMAAIKFVLSERQKIGNIIRGGPPGSSTSSSSTASP